MAQCKKMSNMVKTHTTTSPQYTSTLPLEGAYLLLSCTHQLIGQMGNRTKVHGSREKDGVVWSNFIPQHPPNKPIHCPLKGAQLPSSNDRPNGEKVPKSMVWREKDRQVWSKLIQQNPSSITSHCFFKGA
jgi:hypothetical protein